MYKFSGGATTKSKAPRVQLLGSGTIFREVIAAAELLKRRLGRRRRPLELPVFTELARDGHAVDALEHAAPGGQAAASSHVETCLEDTEGPVIAATDYMRAFAEQIRAFVPRRYVVLGTDGFGRSDTREKLRHFFEVDRRWVDASPR